MMILLHNKGIIIFSEGGGGGASCTFVQFFFKTLSSTLSINIISTNMFYIFSVFQKKMDCGDEFYLKNK